MNRERYEHLACGAIHYLDEFTDTENDGDVIGTCPSCNQNGILIPYTVNKLDYNYQKPGDKPHDPTSFRIQASGISGFFDYTNSWYREKLLGEGGFEGNTSSVLGTALHWAAENYIKDGTIKPENKDEMYKYITEQANKLPDLVNETEIREQLSPMWVTLRDFIAADPGGLVESFLEYEILPGITVGGSIDRLKPIDDTTVYTDLEQLRGKTVDIQDWKSTSSMSPPTKMTKSYEWQLLVYAFVLKKLYDIKVRQISDVFITRDNCGRINDKGKPMKDYPSTIGVVSKPVTPESLQFIESIINIVAISTQSFVLNPGIQRGVLAQDARLLTHTSALPFTKIGTSTKQEDI